MEQFGLNPETLFSATGVAGLIFFILWWFIKELKYERKKRTEAELECDEVMKMMHDNQLLVLQLFNSTVQVISESTEAQRKVARTAELNNILITEVRDAQQNGK